MSTSSGKVWLVTGCSTGLGRALAEAALGRGDRVVATARDPGALTDLVASFRETVCAVKLDVTDRASIAAAVREGERRFGRLDVVVNNAGYGLRAMVEEATDEQLRRQFETNVFGAVRVVREVLPVLRRQGAGHIVNISSLGGRQTVPSMGVYSASKAALDLLSEALFGEVAAFGIKVTIVEPGGFATEFDARTSQETKGGGSAGMREYDELRARMDEAIASAPRGHAPTGVKALLALVDLADPPKRLPLGPGTLPAIVEQLKTEIADYARAEPLWKPTDAAGATA